MSYLKSSLFYLKDINDFLKQKFDRYTDLGSYVNDLYTNEKEVMPFLENVVMNKHYYDLVKYNYIADAKSQKKYVNTYRICSIVFDSLLIAILSVLIIKTLSGPASGWIKGESFLFYVLTLVSVNCILIWCATSTKNSMNDYDGRIQMQIPVESNFIDFDRMEGVAMYYALRRGFAEPDTSPYRRDIKKYYNTYAPTVKNSENVNIVQYPSISNILSNPDWTTLVNSTKHAITTVFETPVIDPKNPKGSPLGYKSNYETIDKQITYSDNITLMKEIHTQGENLKGYIANTTKADIQLTPAQVQSIVTNEIIPAFNVKSSMYHIDGLSMIDNSSMKLVSQPFTVSSNVDCMLNCEMNDSCLVSAFNVPSKKCTLMSNGIPTGAIMKQSTDDVMYVKGDGTTNLFLQGNGLLPPPADLYTSEMDGDCASTCLAGEQCVMYIKNADGKCNITTGSSNIDITTIPKCTSDSNCTFYKETISGIGTKYDVVSMMNAAAPTIATNLVNIVKKYNFELSISDNSDLITQGLQSYFGINDFNSIAESVNTTLDNAQKQADAAKKQSNSAAIPKYISQDTFVKILNGMTYAEFGSFYYSINTLSTVVGDLNTIVQSNISTNLSAENNVFLAQERNASQKLWFIVNISILMVLGFAYYTVSSRNAKTRDQKGGADVITSAVDNIFKILVPLVFISFAIVIMVSSYQKQVALNTYNREVLEKNGGNLVASINDLEANVANIHDGITKTNKTYALDTKMSDMQVSVDDLKNTYNYVVNTVDLLDKCNLLMDGAEVSLPFPWSDVTVNLITIAVCIIVLLAVVAQIDPLGKMNEIRELNIILSKLRKGVMVDIGFMNYDDNDELSITLKVIALVVFIIIVVMFSQKLLQSSQNYKMGLYNSKYYADSKCAT